MNIFNKVTLKTLAKNKTRTIVTIVGIILSAAMFCAVTTFLSSLQNYMYQSAAYSTGDWQLGFFNITKEKLEEYKNNTEIKSLVSNENIGYSALNGYKNQDKPYIYIIGADKNFTDTMPVHIKSGRLPENSSEIILPLHIISNGGVNFSLGDQLNLEICERKYLENNQVLFQNTAFSDKFPEVLQPFETRSYTVVGFYSRPDFENYLAPGYTAITAKSESNCKNFSVYLKMENPKTAYDFFEQESLKSDFCDGDDNSDILMFSGASSYENFYTVLYSLAAILFVIIMFGSISLIYNAFSISISERTRQFGLLSSIGATKKQLFKSVLFEAFFVGIIGIPFGILSGILGIGVTLHFVGNAFTSISYGVTLPFPLSLKVNIPSIVIAVVMAFITILISAIIPAIRATKISAIEAIRSSNDIKIKNKTVKTSKFIYRIFGLEGVIAKKHFKRNKRKYRATVISLFMSIVLFISASSFCAYLKESVAGAFTVRDYDIMYHANDINDLDKAYSTLKNAENIQNHSCILYANTQSDGNDKNLTDEYIGEFDNDIIDTIVCFIDDISYKKFLIENNFDTEIYLNSQNPKGLTHSELTTFNYEEGKYKSFNVFNVKPESINTYLLDPVEFYKFETEFNNGKFDNLNLSQIPYYHEYNLPIGEYTETLPFGVVDSSNDMIFTVVYPMSSLKTIFGEQTEQFYGKCAFKVLDHTNAFNKMQTALYAENIYQGTLYDVAADNDITRNLILILNVFSYGFISLISLIATANVFNTISTNIALRRREFAMLKSVGMTRKGFNKMMNFECLLYGLKSLMYGLPVSFVLTYLIYKSINSGYQTSFFLPLQAVLVAIISVFLVVFATMMYSMQKIKKDNPIDALRNENL